MRLRRISWGIAALLLALALIDLAAQRSFASMDAGEPFVYWAQVNALWRTPLAFAYVFGLGAWVWLRGVLAPLRQLSALFWALLGVACCAFSVFVPLFSVARPMQHMATAWDEVGAWHLAYRSAGFAAPSCEYVLVACDALGLICQQRERLSLGGACLGTSYPLGLRAETNVVILAIEGDVVGRYTRDD